MQKNQSYQTPTVELLVVWTAYLLLPVTFVAACRVIWAFHLVKFPKHGEIHAEGSLLLQDKNDASSMSALKLLGLLRKSRFCCALKQTFTSKLVRSWMKNNLKHVITLLILYTHWFVWICFWRCSKLCAFQYFWQTRHSFLHTWKPQAVKPKPTVANMTP